MEQEQKRQIIENLFTSYAAKRAELVRQYETNRKKRSKIFLQRLRYQLKRNSEAHRSEWCSTARTVVLDSIPTRKIWKLNRCDKWFREVYEAEGNEAAMLESFRMDKDTYEVLVDALTNDLAPHPLLAAQSCSTEKKVGIGLYKLTSGADYATIGNLFGVHKATVKNCVHQFCKAMVKHFMDVEIFLPNSDEMAEISKSFEEKCDIPLIIGAMGRTHIPITPSAADSKNYANAKKWPSLILQAVVDNNHLFRHITCGHVGCTEEAAVLGDSGLYQHFSNVEMLCQSINENTVKSFIVTDPPYPLLPWLMHGYTGMSLSSEEETFNEHLAKAKIVVDEAFMKLRARFRILQRKIDIDINFVPQILLTCCILHNLLEKRQVPFCDEWTDLLRDSEQKYPQPDGSSATSYTTTVEGEAARDILKEYVQSKYMLYRSIDYGHVYFISGEN
ncbi:AGAP003812-PA-like protein [Anopheles sinensis]|uniref:AGAP003812-PA-like protein n=1 Tax=Anopheles sinensis TaxID=74873 RepID=A0A084VC07_ANOSI|nr:AGAP003812-PA-like protein [Anopheles sinensis]